MKMYKIFIFIAAYIICTGSYALAEPPKRIVSLAPSITHALYSLGVESNVVGITEFCPKGTTRKEIIGTMLEPNLEKIIALSPDLVIATKEGNKKEPVQKLIQLNIKVLILDEDRSYKDICDHFLNLAENVDKTAEALRIIEDSNEILARVRERIKGQKPATVFWQVGSRPLFTVGRENFINEITEFSGGKNIFSAIGRRYFQVNEEEVVKLDPDVIFVVFMGDISSEEIKKWRKFGVLKAVRGNKVLKVSQQEFFNPMPLTFAQAVRKISGMLHPEGTDAER
jgi:iron complex transport system substrate-binding protein